MKTLVCLLFFILLFCGCDVSARIKCRNDMVRSKDAYKQCLEQYPDDPSKCETLRKAYEADLNAYQATIGEVGNISTSTGTIFIPRGRR